ncbi:MAG TPA: hypothetical protein PK141_24560 [Polyangiaceae bacterium]|jgi:hypothetical protein|nr:hypothetical protein [Polyangiaceae bacterium]
MILLMIAGAGLFVVGFVTFFVLLVAHGGFAKSRQFGVVGEISSGRQGGFAQVVMVIAFLLMPFGACGMFAAVAAGDQGRKSSCNDTCVERGYRTGRVQGSKAMDPKRPNAHAFVACVCSGGASPDLELNARDLE